MAQTQVRGAQVLNGSIQRVDLDTTTTGLAVTTKVVAGTNITISSSGVDPGTGDVTVNCPTGGTGPAGLSAHTTTTASFTVPAVGSTVTVSVADTSWVSVGQWIYSDDAGGAGIAGLLQVTAKTSNSLTLKN